MFNFEKNPGFISQGLNEAQARKAKANFTGLLGVLCELCENRRAYALAKKEGEKTRLPGLFPSYELTVQKGEGPECVSAGG
jgi:hypothetical protein